MRNFAGFCLGAAMVTLATAVCFQSSSASQATPIMCPVAGDIDSLEKSIDNLAVEMTGVAERIKDKNIATDMAKMQEHLALVSQRLKKMHDEMDTRAGGVMASAPADKGASELLKK